jgi:hypothetical protein
LNQYFMPYSSAAFPVVLAQDDLPTSESLSMISLFSLPSWEWFFIPLAISVGAIVVWLHWKIPATRPMKQATPNPFSEQQITETFIAALPRLSQELNLEIATTWQMEVLERTDTMALLGFDLGTNSAEIRVPVTYRYHIRLHDPWLLERKGQNLIVHAPVIRASQPPAIHTEQLQVRTRRGWCRVSPNQLLQELLRDITPILSRYADDPRRLEFIREAGRKSVAEFVRLWLERERRWNPEAFTAVQVRFRDEKCVPGAPTIELPENN